MFVCPSCGVAQARVSEEWRTQAADIYASYRTYEAGGGEEQKVIGQEEGAMEGRSHVLVQWLVAHGHLPVKGRILDVGCGRGAFLRAFWSSFPAWELYGSEVDGRNKGVLETMPGFRSLQTQGITHLNGEYEMVSMVHVLEHIENPVTALVALRQKAKKGARLLLQVPDWQSNPFVLAIADHATHFTADSLKQVAEAAGWKTLLPVTRVVAKELTLLAEASSPAEMEKRPARPEEKLLASRLAWLQGVRQQAERISAACERFGIFGTAVAGTWVAGTRPKHLEFFVDEDTNRIGRRHLNLPIMSPEKIPARAEVLVCLAPEISARLVQKYSHGHVKFHGVAPLAEP